MSSDIAYGLSDNKKYENTDLYCLISKFENATETNARN